MSFFQYIPTVDSKPKKKDGASVAPPKKPNDSNSFVPKKSNFSTKKTPVAPRKSVEDDKKINMDSSDILFINEQIKKKLSSKLSTFDELKQDLTALIWILNNSNNALDKIQANKERDILRRRMQDLEGGFEFGLYLLKTSDMIEEYKTLVSETSNSRSFMKEFVPKDSAKIFRKNQIISDYLRIAKQYIILENVFNFKKTLICNACYGINLKESDDSSIFFVKSAVIKWRYWMMRQLLKTLKG